jgi:two-component system, NarL family, response regulator YdfI
MAALPRGRVFQFSGSRGPCWDHGRTTSRLLELVGSSLGITGLSQELADTQTDVLLEWSFVDDLEESGLPDLDSKSVARVLLVAEPEFGLALAKIQALDSAVRGVLPRWASAREIQIAIEAAASGLLVFHPDGAEHVARTSDAPARASSASLEQQLSPRESEILNFLAAGLENKEIAGRLGISDYTVKFHVTSIFNKLSVSDRTEAVAVGIRRGLIVL